MNATLTWLYNIRAYLDTFFVMLWIDSAMLWRLVVLLLGFEEEVGVVAQGEAPDEELAVFVFSSSLEELWTWVRYGHSHFQFYF